MDNNSHSKIAFEGETLEEAYKKASLEFNCSITNLKSEVIQAPTSGFLGFFKKNAIIQVYIDSSVTNEENKVNKKEIHIKDVSSKIDELHDTSVQITQTIQSNITETRSEKIFDDFYTKDETQTSIVDVKLNIQSDDTIDKITEDINKLFSNLCYEIDPIKVSYYDKETLYVEFSGKDAALLIGKEGYRYKALSYIIFNWIHDKYKLMVRLEVAEFLAKQEEAIHKYLEPVIQNIKENGFYKTKQLDGILVHIALAKLRDEFPDKYVAVKTNIKGERYILVNEYKK